MFCVDRSKNTSCTRTNMFMFMYIYKIITNMRTQMSSTKAPVAQQNARVLVNMSLHMHTQAHALT
jgi:hypothetical protein